MTRLYGIAMETFNKREKSRWVYYDRQPKFWEFVGLMEGSSEFLDFQLGQFI